MYHLYIEQVNSMEDLSQELISQWKFILDINNSIYPFSDPDWLKLWYRYYGSLSEQLILTIKDQDRLVGIFPLILDKKFLHKEVHLMGFPQATNMEFAILPEYIEESITLIFDYLKSMKGIFVIRFSGLIKENLCGSLVEKQIRTLQMPYYSSSTICPVINKDNRNFLSYYNKITSSKQKNKDRRNNRRLALLGEVTYRELTENDMSKVFSVHKNRWREKLDTSGFTNQESKRFYTNLISHVKDRWKVITLGLFLDDRLIAFEYGYACNGQVLMYRSAHDNLFNIYIPGKMTHQQLIKQCFEDETLHSVNLGIGYEEHKLTWTDQYHIILEYCFSKIDSLSKLIFSFYYLKGTIKNFLKQNRKIVLFKRNRIGKILYVVSFEHFIYHFQNISLTIKKQGVVQYLRGKLIKRQYICFQCDLKERSVLYQNHSSEISHARAGDIQEISYLMDLSPENIIKRLHKTEQCFLVRKDSSIVCLVWVSVNKCHAEIFDFFMDRKLCSKQYILPLFLKVMADLNSKNKYIKYFTFRFDRENQIANENALKTAFYITGKNTKAIKEVGR